MAIELLTPKNFAAFQDFSEEVWDRPQSDAYYRWRYFDAPDLVTMIASHDDRCVASISAFSRPYHNGDETVECLEPFDWYCLPAVKGSGAGVRLLKALMDTGKPLVTLGGSAETLRIIPRLGWKTVSEATEFFLPLSSGYILRNLALPDYWKRAIAPSLNLAASIWFKPAKPNGASNCVVHPVSGIDRTLAQVDGPAGFRSVPDPRYWDWLARGSPATGTYIPLALTANGGTVAWVVGRLHRSRGLLHGTILDLRLKRPDEELAKSAIQYMARALAGFGADDVRAVTTSGLFSAAYRRTGFLAGHRKIPVFAWAGRHQLVTDHISLSCAADDAFCPLQDSINYTNNQIDTPQKRVAGRYARPLYQKSGGAEPLR